MNVTHAHLQPSPTRSALLGFLARLAPDERFAIYPLGRYTKTCVDDAPVDWLEGYGDRCLGFVDDHGGPSTYRGRPVETLDSAARDWPLDALLILRDTHTGCLARRVETLRASERLQQVRIIDQPVATVDAMAAHLSSYHPTCRYEPEFVDACRAASDGAQKNWPNESTLVCTMDGEVFPSADPASITAYVRIMRELCQLLRDFGYSASLCVQLHDTPGGFERTPDAVVECVLNALGPEAVELHGYDHAMPAEGYTADWLRAGCEELARRFGVSCRYWAPPGWTLNWRTLRALQHVPEIQAIRGFWTGVNRFQATACDALRFPMRVGSVWQFPYTYVDWMFMDMTHRVLEGSTVVAEHECLARFVADRSGLMETVIHPYRLVGANGSQPLSLVRQTFESYARLGVRWISAAEALKNRATRVADHESAPIRDECLHAI